MPYFFIRGEPSTDKKTAELSAISQLLPAEDHRCCFSLQRIAAFMSFYVSFLPRLTIHFNRQWPQSTEVLAVEMSGFSQVYS